MTRAQEILLASRCAATDDRRAFGQLVDGTRDGLLAFLTAMTADPSTAADLAQETYIKAWRGLRQWRGTARFSTWLYAIAVNEYRSWARSTHQHDTATPPDEPVETAQAVERTLDVAQAVAQLEPTQRAVTLLYYYNDLPVKRISKLLSLPENTVKSHLLRSRDSLKKILDNYEL